MDFKQLLQLAGENSAFAKKKAERLSSQDQGTGLNVSSSAVSKYLAKQQKIKEQQRAEEEEARRKRVKARLEASLGKKKVESANQQQDKRLGGGRDKKHGNNNNTKFKIDSSHKKKDIDSNRTKKHVSDSEKQHSRNVEVNSKDEKKIATKIRNDHRNKETNMTVIVNENHQKQRLKSTKKQTAGGSSTPGMSFTDLMKLAKLNSENPGAAKKEMPNHLKRTLSAKQEETHFDPDRFVKPKVRKKEHPVEQSRHHTVMPKDKHHTVITKDKQKNGSLSKKKNFKSDNSKDTSRSKFSKSATQQEPVKRGLVMETISSTKSSLPMKTISSSYKQVKPIGGIADQNNLSNSVKFPGKVKRSARDVEAEFEKEERALARKRKLFEMRRITGNTNMQEEDLFGEEDYDLEDEEYEEEDDDFIDDSEQAQDVSKHIRSIFGYDRRRFDDSDDEDLKNMESNYSQIAKEEARSARIAKIEDDYEKMREEEAMARAKMRKTKRKQ